MDADRIEDAAHPISTDVFVAWVIQWRAAVLVGIGLLTLFFASAIPRLVFDTSISDLVIEDLDETHQYHSFKTIFGTEEIIRVVISGQDVFAETTFAKIASLADALGEIDGVERVISLPGVKKAVDLSGTWPMQLFRERVADVPLFDKFLISKDHRTSQITLVLADQARHSQVLADVQAIIERQGPDLTLYQMGMPVISQALARFTQTDFLRLPPATFLVVALLLLLLLRRLTQVLLTLACVALTLVWTLGVIALSGIGISMMILPMLIQRIQLVTLWDLVRLRMGKDPDLEIPLFRGLKRTELHLIMLAGTLMKVDAGQVLFNKGDPSDSMDVILSGRFEVIDYLDGNGTDEPHGIQKHINLLQRGDIVGELGLLRAAPGSAIVVTLEESDLLPINWTVIRRLQWLFPPTALKFTNNLANCTRGDEILSRIDNQRFALLVTGPWKERRADLQQRIHFETARLCGNSGNTPFGLHFSAAPVDLNIPESGEQPLTCTLACLESEAALS